MTPSESWLSDRSRLLATGIEIDNLHLLLEYGESAWNHDLSVYTQIVSQLEDDLKAAQTELSHLESQTLLDEQKFEKDLSIAERDVMNYIRNNTKVAQQVRSLEDKAKQLYSDLQEVGMSNPEIDSKISNLL
jgi:hypothetical protein